MIYPTLPVLVNKELLRILPLKEICCMYLTIGVHREALQGLSNSIVVGIEEIFQ